MELYFATSNRNKFREVCRILGFEIKQVKLGIPEIQSFDLREIVRDKVKKAYERVGKPVIVEDTALYIKSWKNFPGPFIGWVVKTIGIEGICRLVGEERSARARACVGYYDGERMEIFSGEVKGKIAREPRGRKRFDWDRIFIPSGFSRTFAEMSIEEKNRISHRMKAFVKLKRFLRSLHEKIY